MACNTKKPSQKDLFSQKVDSIKLKMTEVKREKIDLILSRLHIKGQFNGNVLIEEKGKILLQKSYGFADFRNKTPLKATSVFRVGSITKQFTAMAIMMLAEDKKLSYADSVQKFLPKLPFKGIKIKHLLSHTSGLPDYLTYFYANSVTYASNQNVISWLENEAPKATFEAGEQWEYSHTNYVILAEIIEKVSKKSFPVFLEQRIFKPLEMKQSLVLEYNSKKELSERAFGFQADMQTLNDDNFLNQIYGDGGMFSTVEDLYKWHKALYTQKLVSSKTLKKAFSPVKLNNSEYYPYGYGWHTKDGGNTLFQMSAWLGFRAVLMRMPKERNCIIILSNHTNPVFEQIVEMIDNILYSRPYRIPK